MKGLEIIELDMIKESEQGKIYEFETNRTPKMILVTKKKGTVFGKKYHKGKHPERFPKVIMILAGEVKAIFKDTISGEEMREFYDKPVMFKVSPGIYQEFKALTDAIILDQNPAGYYKDDTHRL